MIRPYIASSTDVLVNLLLKKRSSNLLNTQCCFELLIFTIAQDNCSALVLGFLVPEFVIVIILVINKVLQVRGSATIW